MTKVKIANYNNSQLEKLYKKYLDDNNVDGCISVLNKMKKTYKDIGFVYFELGNIYFSIEMYEKAKECFFKLLDLKDNYYILRAYNGLGACFYKLQDSVIAGYYFSEQLELDNKTMLKYNDLTAEFFNEVCDLKDKYYLAYPFDKADFTNLLDKATLLMREGDFESAIDLLQIIPKESKFYGSKLTQTAISKYFLNDKEGAIKDIDEAVNLNDKDVIPLLNAINMAYDLKEKDLFDKYLEKLSKIDTFDDDENLLKSFLVYAEACKYKLAKEAGGKYLKKYPYNVLIRFFMGINYLNLCDFENAKNCFSLCLRIENNYVFRAYYDLSNDEKRCYNLINKEKFKYIFDIIPSDKLEMINRIMHLEKTEILTEYEIEELKGYLDYSFEAGFQPLSIKILEVYFKCGLKISKEKLKDVFLSPRVSDAFKKEVVKLLILNNEFISFSIVLNNIYKKISLPKCEFNGENSLIFLSAYSIVCSKIIGGKVSLNKIKKSAQKIYDLFRNNNLTSIFDDVKSLSALIYETAEGVVIKGRRDFIKYFDANAKTLKRYKESYINLQNQN